jgi:hypothetical protein
MKTKFSLFVLFILLAWNAPVRSQNLTQSVRGVVIDQITNTPLPGANVVILNTEPLLGTATDLDGNFKIEKVPVGKHTIRITYLGYKEVVLPNVVVNSGKEVVLSVTLQEDFVQGKEVVITGDQEKNKTQNEMTTVSARTFTVEETQKYAAAVNDPARMASSFAGVVGADDGNNTISIRGNAPNGLQWRMEGVEIPNPNHFSAPGASGGGISILSAQLMSNSDFLTGAFPSEYGNALSGVFDIRLRKGNNEKPEYTLQAGFLGLDAAAEGPFRKGYNGSYLINYRYSTLSVLGKMGVDVGDAATDFQDLSFNVFLPTKKAGNFSLFGFGGLSSQKYEALKDSGKWEEDYQRYSSTFNANTGMAGITHSLLIGNNSYIRSSLSGSLVHQDYIADRLDDSYSSEERHNEYNSQDKYSFATTFNHKFSSRHSIRTGIIVSRVGFDVKKMEYDEYLDDVTLRLLDNGGTYTMQGFFHSQYYLTPGLVLNAGLHYVHLALNNTYSLEPRAALRYEMGHEQSVSLGYGLHSQAQPVGTYFAMGEDGKEPNKNLGFSKSHHIVAGYDRMLTGTLRMKTEVYYQALFNIPVRADTANSFSMVNISEGYITDPLVNDGRGKNYGLELTLEQFLRKNYYYLISGSLYSATYHGSDNKWHDTRYNGNYSLAFTGGKEITTGAKFKNRVIGLNIKTTYRGGFRETPIDVAASQALPGEGTVYVEDEAYTIQNPAYFRADIRVSLKRNRPSSTQTLALDIQNVTNHKNIYGRYYSKESNSVKTYYQTPLIPVLSYRIEF